ncbi:hypothetical protein VSX62_26385, partial [Aurantimonas sp. C2-3-R2]|nr:hypothetical protein [Aurantimonas sp. C2-3-R2]
MIGDAAVTAIAHVPGADEIVLAQLDVGAVGDGGLAASPVSRQGEAGIFIDEVGHRRFQLVGIDMLGIDATQRLLGDEFGRMAGGLAGSEIA